MAEIIRLPTKKDSRGCLTILEKALPFTIQRLYWIYNVGTEPRGRHRHKQTWQALICLQGEVEVVIKKYQQQEIFLLKQPDQVLLLAPEDWHEMRNFSATPIILVAASLPYDANDYIQEPL